MNYYLKRFLLTFIAYPVLIFWLTIFLIVHWSDLVHADWRDTVVAIYPMSSAHTTTDIYHNGYDFTNGGAALTRGIENETDGAYYFDTSADDEMTLAYGDAGLIQNDTALDAQRVVSYHDF